MLRGSSLRLPTLALLASRRAEPAGVLANGFTQQYWSVCMHAREGALRLESHGNDRPEHVIHPRQESPVT
ncbi:hypothetical protein BDQ94DRAFT_137306 [Aspergillus welwitschiae]|uniref:Uncharacterized protein n=1 Tax=Aspergillus welwitschiae TaxID=1341132 RepID=A0A3F3QD21_9EURO|nr:hypothetical protein BDQ94DRAFT_137306 [Aspergillus welwitschiae]RDH37017.1 hypothetical protein BDQ94DRAFT_137306 [Aspergillus welwitschiae]